MEEFNGWDLLIVSGIVFAVIAAIVVSLIISEKRGDSIKGIGGWFILPLIGFIATPLLALYNLYTSFSGDTLAGIKVIFTVNKDDPLALLRIPIIGETFFNIAAVVIATLCLYLIYKRSEQFIIAATIFVVVLFVSRIFDYWANGVYELVLPDEFAAADIATSAPAVLPAILWIAYFHKSKRVRNTFVN
jgi:hypothetical protein